MAGFDYTAGVHVAGTSIWCDAARPRGVCFVSRASVGVGRGKPERVIATDETATHARLHGDVLPARYGRPFLLGKLRLELVPSGRSPGAAQLLVEHDGWRGLYAGAIALAAVPGVTPVQLRACDELVLDAPDVGVVDGLDAIGEQPLHVDDPLAILAIGQHHGLTLGARWTTLAPFVKKGTLRIGRGRRVLAGVRGAREDAIALGLLPNAAQLAQHAVECDAKRVHVRLGKSIEGARELIVALEARGLVATPLGPPQQLSLFG